MFLCLALALSVLGAPGGWHIQDGRTVTDAFFESKREIARLQTIDISCVVFADGRLANSFGRKVWT